MFKCFGRKVSDIFTREIIERKSTKGFLCSLDICDNGCIAGIEDHHKIDLSWERFEINDMGETVLHGVSKVRRHKSFNKETGKCNVQFLVCIISPETILNGFKSLNGGHKDGSRLNLA